MITSAFLVIILPVLTVSVYYFYTAASTSRLARYRGVSSMPQAGVNVQEPPLIYSSIPIIEHLLNWFRGPVQYYAKLGAKHYSSSNIYTLRLSFSGFANVKLYIANSISWVTPIQRHAKTLAFTPFEKAFAATAGRASRRTLKLYDMGGKYPGDGTWVKELHKIHYEALCPGEGLDWINEQTGRSIVRLFDEAEERAMKLAKEKEMRLRALTLYTTDLYALLQNIITVALCDGAYGPLNPLQHKDCEDAYWTFYKNIGPISTGFPSVFFPSVRRAMKTLERRWLEYLRANGQAQASDLVRNRIAHYLNAGVSIAELARLESTHVVALVQNTVPTCFWVLYEILRREKVLERVREEVTRCVVVDEGEQQQQQQQQRGTTRRLRLEATKLRTECPVLLSVFQGTQPTRSITTTIRQVIEDTIISPSELCASASLSSLTPAPSGPCSDQSHDEVETLEKIPHDVETEPKYLLKKGNYVQIHTPMLHRHRELWAEDDVFDPYRFVPPGSPSSSPTAKQKTIPENAFLPWGSAPHVCPGRQYATTSVLVIIAMVVLRFDVVPRYTFETMSFHCSRWGCRRGKSFGWALGKWPEGVKLDEERPSTMQPPLKEVDVVLWPRRAEEAGGHPVGAQGGGGNGDGVELGSEEWSIDMRKSVDRVPLVMP